MKRALMMASVASMISAFNRDNIKILQNMGYQVDIACNFEHGSDSSKERGIAYRKEVEDQSIKTYQLPVPRSILEVKGIITSYRLMKKICEENLQGKYELEVIDLFQKPVLAKDEQIIAAPTLIKELPLPFRRIIGDMSDKDKVLIGLDLIKLEEM